MPLIIKVPLSVMAGIFPKKTSFSDRRPVFLFKRVALTLRGFSSFVKRLTASDVDVHIDLSNVVKGINSFLISAEDITVPVGAAVIQVSPSQVEVSLDTTVRRIVPVEPIIQGKPADGYVLSDVTVEPNVINIVGAQTFDLFLRLAADPVAFRGFYRA